MIAEKDLEILKKFKTRVHQRFSEARIWAYGSRVKGDASWDSDFDIFIVLPKVDPETDRWIRKVAWEVGFENERVITTVIIVKEQFEQGPMSESTLVAKILREGLSA